MDGSRWPLAAEPDDLIIGAEDAHDPYTDDLDAWLNYEWDTLGGDPEFWADLQDFPEPERA